MALEINEHFEINPKVYALISLQTTDDEGSFTCDSCGETIGVKDEKESYSLRFYKWSVALQRSRGLDWETCSVQEIVSAQLLALIEDQAVYKFLTYTGDAEKSETGLMVSEASRS